MGNFQLEDFAAGWIGGAAGVIVGYPLDTVKTRLQAGVGYGNTFSCIRMVYEKERVFGFFKGMSFPVASIAVYNSVVFGVFSNTERFLSRHRYGEPEAGPGRSLSDLLLASMVAGMVSVGLGGPAELIKIRLQMQTQPFREDLPSHPDLLVMSLKTYKTPRANILEDFPGNRQLRKKLRIPLPQ